MQKAKNDRKLLSLFLAVTMLVTLFSPALPVKADSPSSLQKYIAKSTVNGHYVSMVATPQNSAIINPDYDRSYDNYVVTSSEGFIHPGILHTREDLNIMRDMVWMGAEPWASAFASLQKSPYASLDYVADGPFPVIKADRETYALTRASTAAYDLTLMWYITGNKDYADKATALIMSWADTLKEDDKQDQIRMGTAIHKFAIAAEIMRYTPSSGWTQDNTNRFNTFLEISNYAIDKPYQFLNQGALALMSYMAKAIFQDNKANYATAVERLTYNKEGGWKNGLNVNYSFAASIRNSGQFVEMGRDQGHALDDVQCYTYLAQETYVQGTKVDYYGNIVTTGGVDLFDYGGQKLLKANIYYNRYNMGEELKYVPNNALGQPVGETASTQFAGMDPLSRGFLMWNPIIYYHYRYTEGHQETDLRPTYGQTGAQVNAEATADATTDGYKTYGDLYQYLTPDKNSAQPSGMEVDFPNRDDLTGTPLAAAENTPLKGAPKAVAVVDNYSVWNRYGGDKFTATGNSTAASVANDGRNGGAIREPDPDEEGNVHYLTSDVQNGEWIAYSVDFDKDFGATAADPATLFKIAYGSSFNAASANVTHVHRRLQGRAHAGRL